MEKLKNELVILAALLGGSHIFTGVDKKQCRYFLTYSLSKGQIYITFIENIRDLFPINA